MAVSTAYTCDRCGDPIPADRTELQATLGSWRTTGRDRLDLCPSCAQGLADWLREAVTREEPTAVNQESKARKARRQHAKAEKRAEKRARRQAEGKADAAKGDQAAR